MNRTRPHRLTTGACVKSHIAVALTVAALTSGCSTPQGLPRSHRSPAAERAEHQLRQYLESKGTSPLTEYANARLNGTQPRQRAQLVAIGNEVYITLEDGATLRDAGVAIELSGVERQRTCAYDINPRGQVVSNGTTGAAYRDCLRSQGAMHDLMAPRPSPIPTM